MFLNFAGLLKKFTKHRLKLQFYEIEFKLTDGL